MALLNLGQSKFLLKFDDSYINGLFAVQGDTARKFVFTLVDIENKKLSIRDKELRFNLSIKGKVAQVEAKDIDGDFVVEVPVGVLTEYGIADIQLVLKSGNDVLGSTIGKLKIERNIAFNPTDKDEREELNLFFDFKELKQGINTVKSLKNEYGNLYNNVFDMKEEVEINKHKVEIIKEGLNNTLEDEDARKGNENKRESNENKRSSSETTRQENESTRISNEDIRKNNESERTSSEDIRNNNENVRKSEESTRIENEYLRIENENTRKSSEESREREETIRVENENKRVNQQNTQHSKIDNILKLLDNNPVGNVSNKLIALEAEIKDKVNNKDGFIYRGEIKDESELKETGYYSFQYGKPFSGIDENNRGIVLFLKLWGYQYVLIWTFSPQYIYFGGHFPGYNFILDKVIDKKEMDRILEKIESDIELKIDILSEDFKKETDNIKNQIDDLKIENIKTEGIAKVNKSNLDELKNIVEDTVQVKDIELFNITKKVLINKVNNNPEDIKLYMDITGEKPISIGSLNHGEPFIIVGVEVETARITTSFEISWANTNFKRSITLQNITDFFANDANKAMFYLDNGLKIKNPKEVFFIVENTSDINYSSEDIEDVFVLPISNDDIEKEYVIGQDKKSQTLINLVNKVISLNKN